MTTKVAHANALCWSSWYCYWPFSLTCSHNGREV